MKALITAPFSQSSYDRLAEHMEVELAGWGVDGEPMSRDVLLEKIKNVDIFISEMEFADKEVIDAGKNLKVIGSVRGTPFNIDAEYAKEKGIIPLYTPGRNAIGVAELTFFLMGELARHITKAHNYMKAGKWSADDEMSYIKFRGFELYGKRLGLVGLGAIGLKVAKLAQAFNMEVACYDPYIDKDCAAGHNIALVGLKELFATADFVSVHCKVTPETEGMIDYELLSSMKESAYFINTARSKITKEADIVRVLEEGRIAGAALDVFDEEPLNPDHPFLKLDNAFVVPHIGGATDEVIDHHSAIITADLIRFVKGEKPKFIV
ncbi:MAG TPA: dihydrofolate reductase [Firmicutes bacterium]|nr:dihydrofolate reductase [Bacillota bacterium]